MKGLVLTAALLVASGSAYADSCKVEAGSKKTRWRCDDELYEKMRNGCGGSLR